MRFTTVSVPLRDLHRPEEYQRETDLRRARRMASVYDPIQFQPLSVSRRTDDGKLYVWDGLHRLAMAEILGWATIPCRISDLSIAAEAKAFRDAQQWRKGLSAMDQHKALLTAGDPLATSVDRVANDYGFAVKPGPSKTNLQCVAKLYDIYERGNLPETLDLLIRVWDHNRDAYHANLLGGMSLFLLNHYDGDEKRLERMIRSLQKLHPRQLLATYGVDTRYDLGVSLHLMTYWEKTTRRTRQS